MTDQEQATSPADRVCAATDPVAAAPAIAVCQDTRGRYVCVSSSSSGMLDAVYVKEDAASLLAHCGAFAAIDEHVERLLANDARYGTEWAGQLLGNLPWLARLVRVRPAPTHDSRTDGIARRLRARIDSLIANRLFLSRGDVIAGLREATCTSGTPSPISALGIVSGARPEAVQHPIDAAPRSPADEKLRVVVVGGDRAGNPAGPCETVWHVTSEARERLVRFLGDRGIDERVARFAFGAAPPMPVAAGAHRNLLLVLTAGENIISADDGATLVPLLAVKGSAEHLRLHSSHDPRECAVEKLEERTTAARRGLRDAVAAMLGRGVVDLARASQHIEIDSALASAAVGALMRNAGALRVQAVIPGVLGRFGPEWSARFLPLRLASLERLIAYREAECAASANRPCLRYAKSATVSWSDFFETTCFGYNNEAVGIPFSPRFSDHSVLFGAMLRMCMPTACVGYVPEVVRAYPAAEGWRRPSPGSEPVRMTMCGLLAGMIRVLQPGWPTDDVQHWCTYIGAGLEAISTSQASGFVALAYHCAHSEWTRAQRRIEELLDLGQSLPNGFQRELVGLRTRLTRALRQPLDVISDDCRSLTGGSDRVAATQSYVHQFAQLLAAWPAMWKACATVPVDERQLILFGRD
jgi:hypothetical protein